MKRLTHNILSVLTNRPSHALLLFLTGFLFAQVMILNVLYTRDPEGGWITSLGAFPTASILLTCLTALSLCLFTLWRFTSSKNTHNVETHVNKQSLHVSSHG